MAAFNLGHLLSRRGDGERAKHMFDAVVRIGEPSGTPLGRMACAKASLALAAMAERDGLLGAPEAERQYARAQQFGRDSELPEGALAALQATLALGERLVHAGRHAKAALQYRDALALSARCDPGAAARFDLLARLRLGQALVELGEREEAATLLRRVFEVGRRVDEPALRELAGRRLGRAPGSLERRGRARCAGRDSLAHADSGTGALGRATYAHAFQALRRPPHEALAGWPRWCARSRER